MTLSERPTRPARSVDVARLAGVSRSTVSNILNGNDTRFPEATRKRVLEAAHELGYRPSLAGRSLVSGVSDTVVLLLPNTTFSSNLQDAVDEAVSSTMRFGGNVVVRFAGEDRKATIDAITALRPLAVLVFSWLADEDRRSLEAVGTIVVPTLGTTTSGWVLDGGISEIHAEALLARGPRRIWFAALADGRQDPYGPGRYAALERACTRRSLPAPDRVAVPLNLAGAVSALREVIADGLPVGIACYNDDVAIAVLSAARELGIKVPDELSVAGVDNTVLGQLWSPPLTTVDTDLRGLVADYSADLEARLSGTSNTERTSRHRFTLVPGGTT